MKKTYLLILSSILFFFIPFYNAHAQDIVLNGANTKPINFPSGSYDYTRANNNTSIGLAATETGNISSLTAINTGSMPIAATITGTPAGTDPTSVSAPTITVTTATGTISACAGTASASPGIQQFTVSGSSLTGNITAAAPAGFELSLTSGSGYASSITIPQTAGTVNSTIVYVRSAASAPTGNISGKVALTSPGAGNQTLTVTGKVYALPTVNTVANQTVNNGAATTAVNFTGTGNTFTWVNDTPGIGLAASGSGDIASFTAVNTGSSQVVATIRVTPASDSYAYIASSGSDAISIINTNTQQYAGSIKVPTGPVNVAISPDGTNAFVTGMGGGEVISTSGNKIIGYFATGLDPWGIAVSPNGKYVYVANQGDNTVSVINALTFSPITKIAVGANPYDITVSPDGSVLVVSNLGDGTITVINALTNTVIATLSSGPYPEGLAFTPDGSRLYVANALGGSVTVFNTTNYTILSTIPVGSHPANVAISPDGKNVYVTIAADNTVSVISTATNMVANAISVGTGPEGISITPDGKYVYEANLISDDVWVINAITGIVVQKINIGQNPWASGNFIMPGSGCTGAPVTFTITVNPTIPTITATTATGIISACVGTASVSPKVQQFTVSGSSLTASVTATAPPGFEVSLAVGSGYGNSVTIPQTSGTVSNTVVYVRSAAAAAIGYISGNVILTSAGASNQSVAVTGTINALPTVNAVANQTVNNGAATTTVNFTGTGNAYTWLNDIPGIGLSASGMGDIFSFTAVNTGNTRVTATVTVTPALAPYAYITNAAGTVSVINTLTETAIPGTIPVPNAYGVAVSPDGAFVYISEKGSDGVISIISTATNKVVGTIAAGFTLGPETMSPDGSKLYVISYPSSVLVISTKTNSVINTIPADNASDIALSPDGSKLWVVTSYSGIVSIYNTATNAMINAVTVGLQPIAIALSADGSLAYVTVSNSNYVSVINTATYNVVHTIAVGSYPTGEVLSADGSLLYVTNAGSNSISVINTLTNTVKATIGVGTNPTGISIGPDGSQVIVTNSGSGDVSIINTAKNIVIATVPVGGVSTTPGNFIANNTGCTGAPIKFTITVNPSPPTITATIAYGTISACIGTASASPFIQQFTMSGIGLTGSITATAPAGFEISLVPGSGYGSSIVLPETVGVVNNAVIYVRSAAIATTGGISGNITLTSAGASSQTVAVTGKINGPLTLNAVADQTVNNGAPTTPVNFIGTGNTVNWVNDTPGIGLAVSGTGNIPSFPAVNTGSSPVVATITATPVNAGYAYMANMLYNNVSVVNTVNNTVAATLPVGVAPLGVAVSPDGSTVYVTNSGINTGTRSTTMSEINTATNTVTTVDVGPEPYGIVLSPDGKLAYIAVSNFNFAGYCNLAVFNTFTNTIVTYIPIGINPAGVAINANGSRVYVANSASGTVSVINTATNTVIANIAMDSPIGIAISPDGKKLYVTNVQDNIVSVVDVATNIVTGTITVGKYPGGISISPDGSKVYVANTGSNTVSVINTATNIVTATIAVASNPNGICVSPDGNRLYAGSSVINTATNTVIATVTTPNASFGNFVAAGSSCSDTPAKFTITVNPSPPGITATTATGTISGCLGTASASPNIQQFTTSGSGLTASITATAPAGFEISLAPGSGYSNSVVFAQAGGIVNSTVAYIRSAVSLPNGTTTANVLLASPGAADQTVAVTGTVNPVVTASLVIAASVNNICAGTSVTLSATPTNSGSAPVYQWLVNGSNAGTNSPTFSSSTFADGDVVSCVMTSSYACVTPAITTSNSVTMHVTANAAPSVSIVASQNTICAGTPIIFTATPVNCGNAPVYQWLVNNNNAGTNSATFSGKNFADGDNVSCVMTSNAACAAPAEATSNILNISVSPLVSPAISIAASQNNICPGTNVTFTATPVNGGNSPVYQWLLNGNNTGINSATFASSTLANGDIIGCRVTSNAACLTIPDATSNQIAMIVNIQAGPTVSINISANNVCAGTPVTFTASPTNGGNSPVYQWLLNGNNTGTNSPILSSSTFANGDVVSCVITSSLACATPANMESNSIKINIFPLPVVNGGENKTIEKGSKVELTAIASGDIADITWSPSAGLDNNKILHPLASPASTTLYTITVQTAAGCMAQDAVTVTVFAGITIPNTFTPNGDGVNDKWAIQNLNDYPNCAVQIFDRYGGEVYSSKGYYNAWDGTMKGRPLPSGTYYYLINLNNGTHPLSGFVALIR